MNKIKGLFLLFLALAALPCSAQKNVVDEVIWVVGDEPILLSDVEEARIGYEMSGQAIENAYCVIPEQLAIQKLFLHQADLDSIEADETYAIKMADAQINQNLQRYGTRENLEAIARRTVSQLRDMYKKQARDDYRIKNVQRKIAGDLKVTPAEVREYFKNVPQDSLPFVETQVEVQIITTEPKVSKEEVERVENRLREFARRVNSGESDFATLAKFYSQDGSARNGGELGYTGKGVWVPEFANVAFSLNDPKKVSKVVRSEFGFHIIQLIGKRGDKVNVRHILLKPEIEASEYERGIARLDSIATDIRNEKFTFEQAAYSLSDDKNTRNNNGLMGHLNMETGAKTSRFKMDELPSEIAEQVEKLKQGEISPAFTWTNEKGQIVCSVVKLKKRIDGHHANVTEDFQLLKNMVTEKRSQEKVDSWIKEKVKKTYVRINPDWKDCEFQYPYWAK
jgi:peptidyl-prolyl cis-trans isomerase SurA